MKEIAKQLENMVGATVGDDVNMDTVFEEIDRTCIVINNFLEELDKKLNAIKAICTDATSPEAQENAERDAFDELMNCKCDLSTISNIVDMILEDYIDITEPQVAHITIDDGE